MAIHSNTESLLKESLPELFLTAAYCVQFRKNPQEWGAGGCYGYPAAVLLFSIVDTIGSYYRRKSGFVIPVDGKQRSIDTEGFQHFFILNSSYFGQGLTEAEIKRLYENYRCPLLHNAALAPEHALHIGDVSEEAFQLEGNTEYIVRLTPFLELTRKALLQFLKNIDSIVPTSHQRSIIEKKR